MWFSLLIATEGQMSKVMIFAFGILLGAYIPSTILVAIAREQPHPMRSGVIVDEKEDTVHIVVNGKTIMSANAHGAEVTGDLGFTGALYDRNAAESSDGAQ